MPAVVSNSSGRNHRTRTISTQQARINSQQRLVRGAAVGGTTKVSDSCNRTKKATRSSSRPHGKVVVSVDDYGVKADGRNDSEAFEKASRGAVLVVPKNRIYLLKPITFSGPCKPNIALW
ncbi:hypothetical protein RIF29_19227 [Crotalaria pallida]|uniref:Pectate lyase superfamily protein domain-containing protein n=1 Tax=Crotalaria pallida TaxID=3830 RepID=A0AAN9F306_CROPI